MKLGNKLPLTIVAEPEDLFPRNPCSDITLEDIFRSYNELMAAMPIERNLLSPAYSSWNEPMTRQSREQNSLNWKSVYYALQYSMGPRRLSKNLNLAAIASGSTSDGTPPKVKKNGKQS